jgi:4-amino-4-deoxy-L-arabinose transferase-like glycosyltransferase
LNHAVRSGTTHHADRTDSRPRLKSVQYAKLIRITTRVWVSVSLLWLCFLVRATFYASTMPMWEGFDEYSHFGVIEHIALHHDIPDHRTTNTPRPVGESLKLAPWAWLEHDNDKGHLSYEAYWALDPADRAAREQKLRSMPEVWASQDSDPPLQLWEAQQPPLFYWLAQVPFAMARNAGLPTQVWLLRCFCALIASLIIPLGFLAASEVFDDWRLAIAAVAMLTAMPELMISAARISNESLAIAVGALVALLGIRQLKAPTMRGAALFVIAFGIALGMGLLTKAYFLAFLPWALLVVAIPSWKSQKQQAIRNALAMLGACAAIAGWWYIRTYLLTGTITGEEREVAVRAGTTLSLWTAIRDTPWSKVLGFVLMSHIWLGGWSFLVVRSYMYRVVEILMLIAAGGVALQIARPRAGLPDRRQLGAMLLLFASLIAGLCYHATTGFRTYVGSGTMGYYLFVLAVPEATLLVTGLTRLWRWLPSLLIAVFVAFEAYALWILQLPYYAGMIQHTPNGNLPAFRLAQLSNGGFHTMMQRLATSETIFPALFAIATMMLIAITVRALKYRS